MNLNDLFSGSTTQSIIKTIVEKTGLNESQASGALQAALPMILDVVSKHAGSGEGLSGLVSGVVSNLGDKWYQFSDGYPMPGRSYYLNVGYRF